MINVLGRRFRNFDGDRRPSARRDTVLRCPYWPDKLLVGVRDGGCTRQVYGSRVWMGRTGSRAIQSPTIIFSVPATYPSWRSQRLRPQLEAAPPTHPRCLISSHFSVLRNTMTHEIRELHALCKRVLLEGTITRERRKGKIWSGRHIFGVAFL